MTTGRSSTSVVFLLPDGQLDRIDRAWFPAYETLALRLAESGAEVTVAIASGDEAAGSTAERMRRGGIRILPVPQPRLRSQHVENSARQAAAYRTYEWLKDVGADIVHAPSQGGLAFYCLAARRTGAAFARTVFAIHAAPTALARDVIHHRPVSGIEELSTDHMERRSLEWADAIWTHVPTVLEALKAGGLTIDRDRCAVLPVDGAADVATGPQPVETVPDSRGSSLAVVGPVSRSSGLALVRDALARMPAEKRPTRLVLIGPRQRGFNPAEYFAERMDDFSTEVRVPAADTWRAAAGHLDSSGLVLVVAAGEWAAPAVARRLARREPLLILESSPARSLVDPQDLPAVSVPANPNRIAGAIAGEWSAAIARACGGATCDWRSWHDGLAARNAPAPADQSATPAVTVCLIHHERPALLEQALASVRSQDWPALEVVLVDDGSRSEAARAALDRLEPEFAQKGWRIVRQDNAYLGAARNTAVRHARGEYVLFLDDDNVLKPGAIAAFVRAALSSGADIVTSFCDVVEGEAQPSEGEAKARLVFEGDNLALGLFTNAFGDSNALMRRETFLDLGGNGEDYGVGKDDQEFFARAVIRGKRLVNVPEALYWYRISRTRLRHRHFSDVAGSFRVLQPYLEALPADLRPLALLAQGGFLTSRGSRRLIGSEQSGEPGADAIRDLSQDLAFQAGSYRFARSLYRWQVAAFAGLVRMEARLARQIARLAGQFRSK